MPTKPAASAVALVPNERIDRRVLLVRGQKVLLDADLAELYGVETKVLNQAVKRNRERFPADFMFQLNARERDALLKSQTVTSETEETKPTRASRSQVVTSIASVTRGGRRYLPYAFTEQGIAMLSSVLRSPRAIAVNVEIMRAFVRLREMIASHSDLARKLGALEKKYDKQFKAVFEAIRELMTPIEEDEEPPREMGFHTMLGKSPSKPASNA